MCKVFTLPPLLLQDWVSPLPDHSLPHLKIRESVIDILRSVSIVMCSVKYGIVSFLQFPIPDSSTLKQSKIGKAVMLLYRHPKETRKNREKAGKIISKLLFPLAIVWPLFVFACFYLHAWCLVHPLAICVATTRHILPPLQMSGLGLYLDWLRTLNPWLETRERRGTTPTSPSPRGQDSVAAREDPHRMMILSETY